MISKKLTQIGVQAAVEAEKCAKIAKDVTCSSQRGGGADELHCRFYCRKAEEKDETFLPRISVGWFVGLFSWNNMSQHKYDDAWC